MILILILGHNSKLGFISRCGSLMGVRWKDWWERRRKVSIWEISGLEAPAVEHRGSLDHWESTTLLAGSRRASTVWSGASNWSRPPQGHISCIQMCQGRHAGGYLPLSLLGGGGLLGLGLGWELQLWGQTSEIWTLVWHFVALWCCNKQRRSAARARLVWRSASPTHMLHHCEPLSAIEWKPLITTNKWKCALYYKMTFAHIVRRGDGGWAVRDRWRL